VGVEILVLSIVMIVIAIITITIWYRSRDESSRSGQAFDQPSAPGAPPVPQRRDLRSRLSKSRQALGSRLGTLLQRGKLDETFWEDLEDTLVAADVGVTTSTALVAAVKAEQPADAAEAMRLVEDQLTELFAGRSRQLALDGEPAVILVVGVNGGGKTTSIAKLAAQLEADGTTVVLGAADTYRAAANEQLRVWADRIGVPIVAGAAGADPASVAFDAFSSTRARGADVLIVDTAGRLQNQANLMSELAKVANVLRREAGRIDEVLLVIDGTTGQNAISQARSFTEAVGVTGLILTKLDGTARGGVAVAVEQELDLPVKYIGVGEGIFDLVPFDPEDFVDALVGS
jgi:fused signal recognition particle receptor